MNWTALFFCALALTTGGADECAVLEAAHHALLESSFDCERRFTLRMNGDLKMREIARVTYSAGELSREILEREVLDRNLVLEEGEEESALALPFDCERLEWLADTLVELSSADETEKVLFIWEDGSLRPRSWKNKETKRLVWRKLAIEAEAEYRDCSWE